MPFLTIPRLIARKVSARHWPTDSGAGSNPTVAARGSLDGVLRADALQRRYIGQIEPQRRDRDQPALHGPAVGPLLHLLERSHREPEVLPAHRVTPGDHPAIVVPHGLPGPAEALGLRREIDVDQAEPATIALEGKSVEVLVPRS